MGVREVVVVGIVDVVVVCLFFGYVSYVSSFYENTFVSGGVLSSLEVTE